jgi:DNA-binding MarR family transcriptional regulator
MEQAGLVSRTRDTEDERRVLIGLTERGRALRADALHVPETIAGGRSPEGLDELREGVQRLVTMLAAPG